jgi:hypothetical protein
MHRSVDQYAHQLAGIRGPFVFPKGKQNGPHSVLSSPEYPRGQAPSGHTTTESTTGCVDEMQLYGYLCSNVPS